MDKEDNKSGVNEDEANEMADQVNALPAIGNKDNTNGQASQANDQYVIEDNPPTNAKLHDHSQSMTVLPTNSIAKDIENYNQSQQPKAIKGNNVVSRIRSGTIEKIDKFKKYINNNANNNNNNTDQSQSSQSNDNNNNTNNSNENDSQAQQQQEQQQQQSQQEKNGTETNGVTSTSGSSSSGSGSSSSNKDSNNTSNKNNTSSKPKPKDSKKNNHVKNGGPSHKSTNSRTSKSKDSKKNGHSRDTSNSHHRRNLSKTDKNSSSSQSRHSKKTSKGGHSRTSSKTRNGTKSENRRKSMIPMTSSEKRSRSNGPPGNDDGTNSGKSKGRHSQAVSGALANGHHKHRHGSTSGSKKDRRSNKKDRKERKKTYAGGGQGNGDSSSSSRSDRKKHGKHRSSAATHGGNSSSSSSRSGQISSGVQTGKDGKKRNILGGSFIWDENTNLEAKIMYRLKNEIFYIFSYYEPVRIVGSGAYAVVLEAIDKRTNKHVAIKKNKHVFEDVRDARRILREIKLLMHFDRHEDIIELIDTVPPGVDEMSSFSDIYLVTPLLESNLEKIINSKQPLTNLHYQYLTYQILRGLKYIHSTGVIHRDIKPENILVNGADCNVKIIDFGLARGVCKDDDDEFKAANTEYVCTRWYRSPEVMCNAGYYDEKMDIWGVGCILAEMVLRRPLFPGNNYMDQLRHIFDIMGTPKETEWIKSDQAKAWVLKLKPHEGRDFKKYFGKAFDKESDMLNCIDLLQKLLEINPNKRISAAEAIDHIYFKGMHDRKAEKTGEKFDLSFEFENKIATKFGVRHMLCESLTKFHKQIRKKERRELAKLKKKLKERKEQKKREKLKAQQEKENAANGTTNGQHSSSNGNHNTKDNDNKEKTNDTQMNGDSKDDTGNDSSGHISSDDKEHKHSRHHKHHKHHKHSKHKSRSKHKKHGKTNDDNVSESADLDSDLEDDNTTSPKKKKDETAL